VDEEREHHEPEDEDGGFEYFCEHGRILIPGCESHPSIEVYVTRKRQMKKEKIGGMLLAIKELPKKK
jgi:hypothetical protein